MHTLVTGISPWFMTAALAWAWRCPGGRVLVVLGRDAERAARRALSLRTKSLSSLRHLRMHTALPITNAL